MRIEFIIDPTPYPALAPVRSPLLIRSLAAKKAWRSRKLNDLVTGRDAKCSRCGGQRDNLHDRYCYDCRAAYMREWRLRKTRKTACETPTVSDFVLGQLSLAA